MSDASIPAPVPTLMASQQAVGPVVATKLHIPVPLPDRVSRDALRAGLRHADRTRLIVVSAPAGAGKTTLLASWHAHPEETRPFAWLSLEDRDNDPVRFWRGVLAALRTVAPGLGARIEGALSAPGADLSELAMPLLVNELAELPGRVVLVLDDYHVIANADIHGSMQFLIDHLPASMQVAVATRHDPPFGLARLRARAELLELRGNDLRLTTGEAAGLLNDSMGLELSCEQVRDLHARTEGWAAGLQLVGLSLKGHPDRESYIAAFTGDDRQIVDYLAAEVLDRQTPETRRFLLRTSILERLCGPLCDAVLEADDSAQTLVALERANLFLVALDERRRWYRYHHLFRDLLGHELRLTEPESERALHVRAGEWHRANGLIPEAIRHATAAERHAQAVELIAANYTTYVNRGELETVEAWARALPPHVAQTDPRLCLARAWMLLVLGRPAEVEAAVRGAERGAATSPTRDGSRSVQSHAAMVRTTARLLLGDVGAAAHTAELGAELEPESAAPRRSVVTNPLGMAAYWSGASDAAVRAFSETVAAGEATANYSAEIFALGYLATISAERGDYADAEELVDRTLSLAKRQQLDEHWFTTMARYAAGQCARARGAIEPARQAVEHGLELARRGGMRLDTAYGLLALADIASAAGDPPKAEELRARAERQLAACPDPGILRGRLAHIRIKGHPGSRSIADDLSERELAVLRLLPTQLSLRQISDELYVSFNTGKTHARNIYAKLRVRSRSEAVARARELHLL